MRRGTYIRAIGIAVSAVCVVYFAMKVATAWQSAGAAFTGDALLKRLAAASIPLLLGYATSALAWVALMRGLGVRMLPLPGAGIYLTAQFAKYVPGNVGHYVGRAMLSMRYGYPGTMATVSMTLELLLLLLIAALLSLPLLGVAREKFAVNALSIALTIAVLAGGALLLATREGSALLSRAPPWFSSLRAALGRATYLPWHALAATLLAIGIVLSGLSLAMLDGDTGQLPVSELASVVSIFSLAWIAGVLTPGAPAGLGVREAILLEGLAPLMGASDAANSALLFRLLTTLADAATFATGLALLKLAGAPNPSVATEASRGESAAEGPRGAPL